MKRWFVAIIAAATLASASIAAELVTQAKTIAPMMIPAGKDSKAMFQGLKAEALQMGLGEVVLNGLVEYQPQADATTRVNIRWHAIGMTNSAATQSLSSPLTSQFRTSDKSVPPGTVINVRGDLDLLAEDFLKLKARLAKESPKDTVKQVNNNNTTDTARGADALGGTGSSGAGSSYGNSPYSLNNNDKLKTDMVTTQWQDCQPRIDRTAATVYAQARRLDITESGKVMGTGSCEDHGTTAPVVRTYDGPCLPVVDIDNRKVYHQFTEAATLAEKVVPVSACTADFTKFDAVKTSLEGCGYRHDFTAGRSVLQEKLFYNDLTGKVVPVRDCGDSTTAYAQYSTKNTCPATIDNVNKQVFINVRTAFMDGNGAEQYASDCKPDGNASKPISEEFCTPKYEHDFVNHVSYYRTRAYYIDATGNKIYVSECGRSATDSFPHIFETGSCGVRNDDAKLMTYWSKVTQINSPTDGIVEIAPCQETNSPTPYAFTGRTLDTAATTVATNALNGRAVTDVLPGEAENFASGLSTVIFPFQNALSYLHCPATNPVGSGFVTNALLSASNGSTFVPPSTASQKLYWGGWINDNDSNPSWYRTCASYTFNTKPIADRIIKRAFMKRYLRGDGTFYQLPEGAQYTVEVGN